MSIADAASIAGKSQEEIDVILGRVADEIRIFTAMARTFTDACFANDSSTENGLRTLPIQDVAIPAPLLVIIQKVWPSIVHVAADYSQNEVRLVGCNSSLCMFLLGSTSKSCSLAASSFAACGECSRYISC